MRTVYKKELEDLIRLHDILKKEDDFYYASYIKDYIKTVKRRLKKQNDRKIFKPNNKRL